MIRQSRLLRLHCSCLLVRLRWVAIVELHLVLVLPGVVLCHRILHHNHIFDYLDTASHTRKDTAAVCESSHFLKAHSEGIFSRGGC